MYIFNKWGELGEVEAIWGLKLTINSHLTDNWQIDEIFTDNWHCIPHPDPYKRLKAKRGEINFLHVLYWPFTNWLTSDKLVVHENCMQSWCRGT